MTISLREKIDPVPFLKAVNGCQDEVWMVTDYGDRLNLKSALSTYLFALMAGNAEDSRKISIVLEEPDLPRLLPFLEMQ